MGSLEDQHKQKEQEVLETQTKGEKKLRARIGFMKSTFYGPTCRSKRKKKIE